MRINKYLNQISKMVFICITIELTDGEPRSGDTGEGSDWLCSDFDEFDAGGGFWNDFTIFLESLDMKFDRFVDET